jgi:hypothetical protein
VSARPISARPAGTTRPAAAAAIAAWPAAAIVVPPGRRRAGHAVQEVVELSHRDRACGRRLTLVDAHQPDIAQALAGRPDHLEQPRQPIARQADLCTHRVDEGVTLEAGGCLLGADHLRPPHHHSRKLGQCSHGRRLPAVAPAGRRPDERSIQSRYEFRGREARSAATSAAAGASRA